MNEEGFAVNDPQHLENRTRETNGWGLTKSDLIRCKAQMVSNVSLTWDPATPPEMRKVLAEAAHVLHEIAERAIMAQLRHDGLLPLEIREILYGATEDGGIAVVRDSNWHGV
jgi:hypothetical protein